VHNRDLIPGQRVERVEERSAVLLDRQHEVPAVTADELGGRRHRVQSVGGDDRAVQVDLPEHGRGHRHLIGLGPTSACAATTRDCAPGPASAASRCRW